ncbi:ribonuclease II, chloroplastic/mitochondrial isoform X1 [Cinnamomum micranthum f. kanehirae]|uniref:Ribonuclease II, chloroplastic/mitochondrial isoform X1 n=1 Tax=Cinnamomum micranthum f. kanehirae TaxID=337451 RepID=A0A3S3PQ33_9MAGN|nr:ribonuclease II, chloroplastic/mitochondrial isoform X1 [Cinnamomum micranthum f. kanehirae]
MAVRVVNSCPIFRCACSPPPPLSPSRCLSFHFRPFKPHKNPSNLGFHSLRTRSQVFSFGARSRFFNSLVESVMEELKAMSTRRRIRANGRVMVMGSRELVEDKIEKWVLQKGLLLEFRKDSEKVLLAVAQKPDGKKNWMVSDQNGTTSSIKPQQITYIVPGVQDFNHADISDFIERAQNLWDSTLLEYAWVELLEKEKSVTAEELAEIIYGSTEPLESYCAHFLLSKDEVYFNTIGRKGSCFVYEPRPSAQVEELLQRKRAKEDSERELQDFVQLLMSAKAMSSHCKPPKSSWTKDEKIKYRIESLVAYAIDACKSDDQKRTAGMILKAMGLPKVSSVAVNLLIDIGYFPVHVNLDLLKFNIRTEYSDEILAAAENLLSLCHDPDMGNRKDLTFLKVYAIDVDEADELDDALSATRLQDGRIKVWIHVADPTFLVQPRSILDKEAMRRGTSVFLPTATFPMFPEKLAMEGMSLKQGKPCNAVSVSVVMHPDGSISEYTIDNSIIRPTYMLTYESATELLHLNLEEEAELRILSEAAALRLQWRRQQGAIDTSTIEARIKVANPDDPEPSINLYVENQSDPAMRLVSEMMILCGEAIATFGSYNNIPLPYRGQPQSAISDFLFSHLPEGPVRSSAYVKIMRAAEMDFRKPIRHGVLGLPGYVQFTSPIRRYMDLLAHYQVKAFLRGDSLPFSAGELEGVGSSISSLVRRARTIQGTSLRYWLLEYLRRQPKEKKFRALILRFIKDRIAALLLMEVGIQASASVSVGSHIGDEIEVRVEEAHPREDVLYLKEVLTS